MLMTLTTQARRSSARSTEGPRRLATKPFPRPAYPETAKPHLLPLRSPHVQRAATSQGHMHSSSLCTHWFLVDTSSDQAQPCDADRLQSGASCQPQRNRPLIPTTTGTSAKPYCLILHCWTGTISSSQAQDRHQQAQPQALVHAEVSATRPPSWPKPQGSR